MSDVNASMRRSMRGIVVLVTEHDEPEQVLESLRHIGIEGLHFVVIEFRKDIRECGHARCFVQTSFRGAPGTRCVPSYRRAAPTAA
jgi:hypothetical protein